MDKNSSDGSNIKRKKRGIVRDYIYNLKNQIKAHKRTFVLYSILRGLVIFTLVRELLRRNFESASLCILSLLLFLLPAFFEKKLKIKIPALFEACIYLFIFSAEILGEINHYYVLIPGWDTMLHTINGFLCAAVGFSLVDLLNQKSAKIELSPLYLAIVAFCFSMTIGVLWEFFEFFMDDIFFLDMQKDFIVNAFSSVTLDPAGMGKAIKVMDITKTTIETASGQNYIINGYLDIGIIDTMKDLFVNFIGAVVFSIIGYLYVKNRNKKSIAEGLIIKRDN